MTRGFEANKIMAVRPEFEKGFVKDKGQSRNPSSRGGLDKKSDTQVQSMHLGKPKENKIDDSTSILDHPFNHHQNPHHNQTPTTPSQQGNYQWASKAYSPHQWCRSQSKQTGQTLLQMSCGSTARPRSGYLATNEVSFVGAKIVYAQSSEEFENGYALNTRYLPSFRLAFCPWIC